MQMLINPRKSDIASRAMLVSFGISQWTAHKRDKATSAEIADAKGASRQAGNYNKVLIGKDALSKIQSTVSAARQDHAFYTLPWLNDGTRILPVQAFEKYSEVMRKHREAFDSAVSEFIANYPDYVENAKQTLGALFNYDEYPMRQEIRKRFSWQIGVMPMPDAADFRVDMDQATVLAMQGDMQNHIESALKAATSDAMTRIHGVAKAMADRLAAYDPTAGKQGNPFRDSLVGNVRELLEILPALNLTNDSSLATMIETVRDKLAANDAAELRDNPELRAETAKEAKALADQISDLMDW